MKTLQITGNNSLAILKPSQKRLLNLIENLVLEQRPCTFDDVVACYSKFVRKNYSRERRKWIDIGNGKFECTFSHYDEYGVMEEYKKNSSV